MFLAAASGLAAQTPRTLRGRLVQEAGAPKLSLRDGPPVLLEGDAQTMAVLKDERLAGAELEVVGEYAGPNRFLIQPIHTRAMFVHRDGRKLMISYWCELCSIRTYSPGKCMCCQDETALDLKESFN